MSKQTIAPVTFVCIPASKYLQTIAIVALLGFLAPMASAQTITLKHTYYTTVYDTVKKAPIYTTYTLTKAHLKAVIKRKSTFYADELVGNNLQAFNGVYKNNGVYDKGHLSPAADFCFNAKAYRQVMYYTNTAPQQEYFNEHLWEAVEEATRDSCRQYGNIKVFTGCLYGNKKLDGIAIPTAYWKVIIYDGGKKAAWLGQNKKPSSNQPDTIKDKVSDIEAKTGLRFE